MRYTNLFHLPQSISDAITKETYDLNKLDPKYISVTTLINPPIVRQLYQRHFDDIEEDLSENVWRLLGSAVHSVLERTDKPDRLIEERINIQIGDRFVSGKPDLYEDGNIISDYKVTSTWTIIYRDKDKDKQWEKQLNCYAWLYRKAGFQVDKLRVIAILRDWQKSKAQKDNSYPQIPIVVVEIPLWSVEEQWEYITTRLRGHIICEDMVDKDLVPCSPEERWHDGNSYAVFKNKNKTATRVFKDRKEANNFCWEHNKGKDFFAVTERRGVDKKCVNYCGVNQWCEYYKSNYPNVCVEKKES